MSSRVQIIQSKLVHKLTLEWSCMAALVIMVIIIMYLKSNYKENASSGAEPIDLGTTIYLIRVALADIREVNSTQLHYHC